MKKGRIHQEKKLFFQNKNLIKEYLFYLIQIFHIKIIITIFVKLIRLPIIIQLIKLNMYQMKNYKINMKICKKMYSISKAKINKMI
jgi:hypothetical protein